MKSLKSNKIWLYVLLATFLFSLILPVSCAIAPQADAVPGIPLLNLPALVSKVEPSVVAISTESVTYDSLNRPITEEGAGSGWIMDPNGIIVTNNHVIEGATSVTVEFSDHKAYPGQILQTDPTTDVAVVKIDTGKSLPRLKVADTSKIKVGDWVIVVGNPLGLGISVKQGIVSRLGVNMSSSPGQAYNNLIETSAAINPGNSGGPMVNMDGEIIGINSLKISQAGIEGMGYAITIDDVFPILQILAKGQPYLRPWLGTALAAVDNGLAVEYQLPVENGALVVSVSPHSPADQAGIIRGDIIVGFNNLSVTSDVDLKSLVEAGKVGEKVKLTYWRSGVKKAVEVTLDCIPPTPTSTTVITKTPSSSAAP